MTIISQYPNHYFNLADQNIANHTNEILSILNKYSDACNIFLYSNNKLDFDHALINNYIANKNIFYNVGEGGEGVVFLSLDKKLCVKVYKKKRDTEQRKNKLDLMIRNQVDIQGICWPLEHINIYGRNGFLMRSAKGIDLFLLLRKKTLENDYPQINRVYLCNIAIRLFTKIKYLHDKEILIGDINLMNIWIDVKATEAYLIDTDSFQIGEFPCPVGSINFTAPEIQGKNFTKFQRSKEHEYFSIATLLFMIFHAGKTPYSHMGGGDPGRDIKDKNFPYPFGGDFQYETPKGVYENMWNHLSYDMKGAFYDVFKNGERLNIEEWLDKINTYKEEMETGDISNTLFSDTYKRTGVMTSVIQEGDISVGESENEINPSGKGFGVLEMSTKALKLLWPQDLEINLLDSPNFDDFRKTTELVFVNRLLNKKNFIRVWKYNEDIIPQINKIKEVAIENNLKYLYAFGGSIYRAANNRDNILDMIKNNTGLNVKIISPKDEGLINYYGYHYMSHTINQSINEDEMFLLFEFGSGSVRLSIFNQNNDLIWDKINSNGYTVIKDILFNNQAPEATLRESFNYIDKYTDSQFNNIIGELEDFNNYNLKMIGLGGPFGEFYHTSLKKYHNKRINYEKIENSMAISENKLIDKIDNVQELTITKKYNSKYRKLDNHFTLRVCLPIIKRIMRKINIDYCTLSGATLWYGLYYNVLTNKMEDINYD